MHSHAPYPALFPYTTLFRSSLSLVLFDREARAVERSAAEALKVMGAHDGTLVEETYNLLNAWLTIIPRSKSTRLNSSHVSISYAVFCLKKKRNQKIGTQHMQ